MATARSLPGRPARPTILVVDDAAALCASNWLEAQLALIEPVGEGNCLAQQIKS